MPLLRPALRSMLQPLRLGMRAIATTPVRAHTPLALTRLQTKDDAQALETKMFGVSASGSAALAASPLLLTEPPAPGLNLGEFQFVIGKQLTALMESLFEVEGGPLFLNALGLMAMLRFGFYYCWWQPSYVWHFQERYGQTWNVGHHLYGAPDLPNPLKKGK